MISNHQDGNYSQYHTCRFITVNISLPLSLSQHAPPANKPVHSFVTEKADRAVEKANIDIRLTTCVISAGNAAKISSTLSLMHNIGTDAKLHQRGHCNSAGVPK